MACLKGVRGNTAVPQEGRCVTSLDDLVLFVGIVDAGSLAGAARAAGMPKSSVSRRLAALEARLNTRLLQRNTRRLSLTDAGQRLYERCVPLIAEAEAAEADIRAEADEPTGVLKVTATGAFGRLYVGPLLGAFLALHPRLRAELSLLDRVVNLIDEGFDLAIRMGALTDSQLMGRKLGDIPRVLVAAPDYLARFGHPAGLSDLRQHAGLRTVSGNRWSFDLGGTVGTASAPARLTSNRIEALHEAALQGCGLAVLPRFLVFDDLAAGRLQNVLPQTPPTAGGAHALWPSNRNLAVRTRAFIDFIAERLALPGALERSH